jgi:hypothetical protein
MTFREGKEAPRHRRTSNHYESGQQPLDKLFRQRINREVVRGIVDVD